MDTGARASAERLRRKYKPEKCQAAALRPGLPPQSDRAQHEMFAGERSAHLKNADIFELRRNDAKMNNERICNIYLFLRNNLRRGG